MVSHMLQKPAVMESPRNSILRVGSGGGGARYDVVAVALQCVRSLLSWRNQHDLDAELV